MEKRVVSAGVTVVLLTVLLFGLGGRSHVGAQTSTREIMLGQAAWEAESG
jgi:hypothetical protein